MSEKIRVEWVAEEKLSEEAKTQIEQLNEIFFPDNLIGGRYRFGAKLPHPHRLLLWDDKVLAAHLLTVVRTVSLDGQTFQVMFIGELCVRPEFQGKGLGKMLLASLLPNIKSLDLDMALLCCRKDLQGFYEKSGWKVLDLKVMFGPTETISRCSEGIIVAKVFSAKIAQVLKSPDIVLYLGEPI